MLDSNFASSNLLTEAESLAVDQTLLSAQEKFSTRVALYSLRIVQAIAPNDHGLSNTLTAEQILNWLAQNQPTMPEGLQPDLSFYQFFSQLVLSSLKPLRQIAMEHHKTITELEVSDVITWFEQQAKVRVEQGKKATFLGIPETPA